MSNEERFSLKRWLLGVSAVMVTQIVTVLWIGISDHFQLQALAADMAIEKPRVDEMWYQHQQKP